MNTGVPATRSTGFPELLAFTIATNDYDVVMNWVGRMGCYAGFCFWFMAYLYVRYSFSLRHGRPTRRIEREWRLRRRHSYWVIWVAYKITYSSIALNGTYSAAPDDRPLSSSHCDLNFDCAFPDINLANNSTYMSNNLQFSTPQTPSDIVCSCTKPSQCSS